VFLDQGGTVTLDSSAPSIGQLTLGGTGSGHLQLASTATLDIGENFSQSAGGTLAIELDDFISGSLSVGGTASLAGTLQISLDTGYSPDAGDAFELISATEIVGAYDDIQLPEIAAGLAWHLDYGATSVDLVVLYAADFDHNGTVNSHDLSVWQEAFGTNSLGDADGDGDTDGRDFLVWQRQFGSSVPLGLAAQTIPEPGTCFLFVAVLIAAPISRLGR
jgi:hypothetical protein